MSDHDGRLDEIRPTLRELGKEWAQRRRQVERQCEVCGTTFTGLATRRYCSAACRTRAYRQRLQEPGEGQHEAAA